MKLPYLSFVFGLFLLNACTSAPPQNPYPNDRQFQSSAPNKILFNNLRSTQYRQQEDPQSRVHRYFHKKWFTERDQGGLGLVIVDNWLFDQVYLEIVQIDSFTQAVNLPLRIEGSAGQGEGKKLELTDDNWLSQLQFGRELRDLLQTEHTLQFRTAGGKLSPVFPLSEDIQYYQQVFSDFEQLVQ